MKKIIVWVGIAVLVAALSVVYFSLQRKETIEDDVPEQVETNVRKIGDTISIYRETYQILEMELNDDLRHFPELVGKTLDTVIPIETDDTGKITNGVKILTVRFLYTNNDPQDPDALVNAFMIRNAHSEDGERVSFGEMELNDFRNDQGNHEYFHSKLKTGESKEIWVGFILTDQDLQLKNQALCFEEGDVVPIDFDQIKKTY